MTVGARNGSQAWVRSGLAAGAQVIVYPPAAVADGGAGEGAQGLEPGITRTAVRCQREVSPSDATESRFALSRRWW